MNRYDAGISTLFIVEQHLLTAAVSLRSAQCRLGDGRLREEIRDILRSVEATANLSERVKRVMLMEWRLPEASPSAA